MAWEVNTGNDIGQLLAGADLSGSQFLAVKISTGTIVLASTDDEALGILQNNPISGQAAAVRGFGITQWKYGGSITAGDKVAVDSAGKCVRATVAHVAAGTPEPLVGSHVIGTALLDGSNGDTGSVFITHAGLTN